MFVSFQAMDSVTVENANATQVTLGTIVTAQQTSAHAGPRMGRSAVTEAVVSVGSASAQSLEPLGRRVRSAQPARMLAALRETVSNACYFTRGNLTTRPATTSAKMR